MKMKQRQEVSIFSLSFLDAICCGFGAIIILFVLSKGGEPLRADAVPVEDRVAMIQELEEQIHAVYGETSLLQETLTSKQQQLAEEKEKLARLRGDLSDVQGEFAGSTGSSDMQNTVEGELTRARQKLTDEMKRLLASIPTRKNNPVGGIPIDSEYIIFMIDTSGSMQSGCWPLVEKKMREILRIYPRVKGIQVMNDMGKYMFSQYAGRWIPDSPARREAIVTTLRGWRAFSNSSPVEGLTAAIRTFYDPHKKISIYVLGDEFSGMAMQPVIDTIDRINRIDETGARRVRIHAVGFPVMFHAEGMGMAVGPTGDRFATLMREVCERNGGAFVGLNSIR